METQAELVKEGLEGSSTNNPTLILKDGESPNPPSSYVQTALQNPVILESVFKNLDVSWIKIIREVCRTWNRVATPSFRRNSQRIVVGYPGGWKNLDLLILLLVEDALIHILDGWNYRLCCLESSQFSQITKKLSGSLKNLTLWIVELTETDGMFAGSLHLPFLESLDVYLEIKLPMNSAERKSALAMSQMVNRAPEIRNLKMDIKILDTTGIFWETFLGPEGLGGGTLKLIDKLNIKSDAFTQMSADSIRSLRRLKLKLREFYLDGVWYWGGNAADAATALFLFIQDQSSCLETLFLKTTCFLDTSVFLSPMKKLKRLEIQNMECLAGNCSVLPLLLQLPLLETFTLVGWKSLFSVVKRIELESFQNPVFPNLQELKVDFTLQPSFFSGEIGIEYCPPYIYVPKLFPNLRTLSFHIFSNHQLISCIHELRGTLIEELELKLVKIPEDLGAAEKTKECKDEVVDIQVPSFNNWKQLRKLKLEYERGVALTHVFDIPLEDLLSKGLTSLEIFVRGSSVFQTKSDRSRMDYTFLIKILRGLPLLMQFKVDEDWILSVCGTRETKMKRSYFMEQIREDPFINYNLNISLPTGWFAPEEEEEES